MGIIGPLGNNLTDTSTALRKMRSGIVKVPDYATYKFGSQVAGVPVEPTEAQLERIPRAARKNMAPGALYNVVASLDALEMAGLSLEYIRSPQVRERVGAIMATGTGSTQAIQEAANKVAELAAEEGRSKPATMFVGSTTVVARTMASTNSANHQWLGLQGPSFTISSACASSAIAIGEAALKIIAGQADIMLAGGGDNLHWTQSSMFDGMPALCRDFNDEPQRASRAFDKDRAGFVIAGGGATLVLESLDHAMARGATIIAELIGYGNTTDGSDSMTEPATNGPIRAMRMALRGLHGQGIPLRDVDYINPHGTSTLVGDLNEMKAIQEVFADTWGVNWHVRISSTKSLTGHSLGTAGAHEAIYCLLMLRDEFMAGSANLDELDAEIAELQISKRIITETYHDKFEVALSNSFGFGGTNASLIFSEYYDGTTEDPDDKIGLTD
jgi:3-oxoacyl-[acyl-carrier-protein] synthase-1